MQGGELRLRVELRGTRLYLAVQDPTPPLLHLTPTPAPPTPDPKAEGARGLWLVEHLATAWGRTRQMMTARWSGASSPANRPTNSPAATPTRPQAS